MATIELMFFWIGVGITIVLGIGTAYTIGIVIDLFLGGDKWQR